MADVTLKKIDELEGYEGPGGPSGAFLYAGKNLGVTAWGMNVLRLPPNWSEYPEHDHTADGQEEVYVVLEGSAKLEAGGESWPLEPGMLVRVGPGEKRAIAPGEDGVTLLALGGTPGRAYEPPSWMQVS
ncbi:MAG TPA: cupin domain-containing protein [Gemmatimonadota bacterium]|nr:cupin domain-containing protein [Gemmatimonadota bacterium]